MPSSDTQFNSKTGAEAGRKSKRGPSVKLALIKQLEDTLVGHDRTAFDEIIFRLVEKAANEADLAYIKEIFNRIEGLPTQKVEQKTDVTVTESPIAKAIEGIKDEIQSEATELPDEEQP